ncbi:MAG: hypothetical protein A2X94_06840 [Bdellovibrionales bacterium GWB1_55_8]|nr:MAG: hypothetical protein A2X94_06840 [Bdellovibrionales bacterium GWB1_55_8]
MKQASFLPSLRLEHGGGVRQGRRKVARPFSHKHPIYLVLRSSRAQGKWSLLTRENAKLFEHLLADCARRYRIRVYRSVNVGNHLHLLVKADAKGFVSAKRNFQGFLREFSGALAFQIMGARKTNAKGRFWDRTLYSRIISWGHEFKRVTEYFTKNFLESKGLWSGSWDPFQVISNGVGPPGLKSRAL